ncbi:unnamed protein product [Alternaria alternata]
MPSIKMPSFGLGLPRDASPRLRIIQGCQIAIAALSIFAVFITLVFPVQRKLFTLSLLYTPILTSATTIFLIVREQRRAAAGTLSKQKYVKYQILKMAAAFGMSIIGFIGHVASTPTEGDAHRAGQQGLWISGVKINKWQGLLLWLNFFNWQGAIALSGEEALIGADSDSANDEAIARALQAQDGNWQA